MEQFTPIHKLSDKCFGGVYDQHTYIEYCKENVCIIIVLSGKPAIKPPPPIENNPVAPNEVIVYRVMMYANPLLIVQGMYFTVLGRDF